MLTQVQTRSKLFTARQFFAEIDSEMEDIDLEVFSNEPSADDLAPYVALAAGQD